MVGDFDTIHELLDSKFLTSMPLLKKKNESLEFINRTSLRSLSKWNKILSLFQSNSTFFME